MKELQEKLMVYESALKEIAEKADTTTTECLEYHDAYWAKFVACKALGIKMPWRIVYEE